MSASISAWLIALDPLHWAERESLVYLEANAVVVSLFVVKEPANAVTVLHGATQLILVHIVITNSKKINSAFENERIITILFRNTREEICADYKSPFRIALVENPPMYLLNSIHILKTQN